MKISKLTCENRESTLGVNTQQPVFGWRLECEKNGEFQKGYRILVTDEENCTIWDSGDVASDKQLDIPMTSPVLLRPMEKYFFLVEVTDGDGVVTAAQSWFLTGFLRVSEWKSQWLIVPYSKVQYFRREFMLEQTEEIEYAFAFIASVGEKANSCVVELNGFRVGEQINFPGATEYFRAAYTAVDISGYIRNGVNVFALKIAKTSSLILKIKYKKSKVFMLTIVRDEWKRHISQAYTLGYSDAISRGKFEEYDATKEPEGWREAGFDDSGWDAMPTYLVYDWGPLFLTPQFCTAKIQKTIKPVRILRRSDSVFVDFGTNMAGFVRFTLASKRGQQIEVRYYEKLNAEGSSGEMTSARGCYLKYTFASDQPERYAPAFMHTGFRAVEILGFTGEVGPNDIEACMIYSDILDGSSFSCSEQIVNRLYTVARQSFLSNLVNIPTDCPERERRGWTADTYAVCAAECVNFDMLTFFYQWLDSMRDCQRGNGWIPVELPLSTDEHVDVNWPAACVFIPYDVFIQYGDKRFLEKYYDVMCRWVEMLCGICDEQYEFCNSFLSYKDWLAQEPATSAFLGTAYFFRTVNLLTKISGTLGKRADKRKYTLLAKDIKSKLNNRFLKRTETTAFYDNGSQSTDAHALFFEIYPEEYRGALVCHLVESIKKAGCSTSGFMGTMCLMQALSANGRSDAAFDLLMNRKLGGWIYLLEECDATTFPESYDGSNSQNHAFLGSAPGLWLYKYLVGISPLVPGYKKVRIAPYIAKSLSYAQACIETRYGMVFARWEKIQGTIRLTVQLPANVTGEVEFGGKIYKISSGRHIYDYPFLEAGMF